MYTEYKQYVTTYRFACFKRLCSLIHLTEKTI